MTDVRADQLGVISGMLSLSRNLGLITGASAMGAVFAFASATTDITTVHPQAVAAGMRATFAVAALLIVVALAVAMASRALTKRRAGRRGLTLAALTAVGALGILLERCQSARDRFDSPWPLS